MSRFPELTEADAEELVRIVEHAVVNRIGVYLIAATQGPWQLVAIRGKGRLPDVPNEPGFYDGMAAAGYFLLAGDGGRQLRPTPLAYSYARYRRRRRLARRLSDVWYWLNADRPIWLRSFYGCLTFLVGAFATGIGFVIGLWLAHRWGIPLT